MNLILKLLLARKDAGLVDSNPAPPEPQEKKPLKPCCACRDQKARDGCIIEKGEEHCGHLIEAHKECMRALGFKI
ncbi:PREDICTED: LOW QUALITY PROTEIN: cytochrome c oxidase copper chaperone [Cercocebus atys]|uniref:LOW QUALITY PROTEIN: cytochrome c oxidase copper chaperone n=1 Tax=Cercocebus atys TaxID=9531 RepID=UPI0005F3C3CE|nr:PREDICTED: LOW QUALITY PROTEIN: cytochrome c oxidase copper chaperone [Cercocebus atys]